MKKSARIGTVAGSWPMVRLRRWLYPRPPCVRVLTWHRFANLPNDPFAVRPERFAEHVAWLAASGRVIGLEQFAGFLDNTYAPPSDALLLTIDDGFISTLSVAAPILARHRLPAVAFVSAGLLDTDPGAPERYLTTREVAALPDYGIAVGSHAWSHVSLGAAEPAVLRREMTDAKRRLEDIVRLPVTAFAYPYGTRRDYSPQSRQAASRAEYRFCFTTQHGAATSHSDALQLPRIKIEGGEGLAMLAAASRGGLDGWALVDRFLWRLQATGARHAGVVG